VTIDGVNGEVWTVLSEPSRRAICMHLAERPRAVGELAKDLPISRPAVSQHLRVLKTAGLVIDEVVGTFWNRALAGYRDAVTTQSPSGSTTQEEET
jgi:DNA-binding transcriptional ArsR family regulator